MSVIQDLVYRIGATNSGLKATVRDSQTSIRSLMNTVEQSTKRLDDFGRKARRNGLILLTGITTLTKSTLDSASSFEKSMKRVQAVSQATAAEYRKLSNEALSMSTKTEHSALAVADGMNFMAMAGFKANQIMEAMPSVLQLASAGMMELGQSADIITNILTGYGMEISELAMVNDVLVSSMTGANVDLVGLGEAFKYAGPVAKAAGIEFKETASLIALMGNAGIQGSMAGTSLRQAMTQLLNPTKSAQDVMKRLGVVTRDLRTNQLLPLTEILKQLEVAGADASDMMILFGQRAGPAMSALLGQGTESLESFQKRLEESEGLASKIELMMLNTAEGQKSIFRNTTNAIKTMFGQDMLPYFRTFIFYLQGVADKLKQLEPEQRVQILRFGAMAGAVVGLVTVLGILSLGLSGIIKTVMAVGNAFTFLMSVKGLAIVGIIFTLGLLKTAWDENWGDIQGKTKVAVDFILAQWNRFLIWIGWEGLQEKAKKYWADLLVIWNDETTKFPDKVSQTIALTTDFIFGPGTYQNIADYWNGLQAIWLSEELSIREKLSKTFVLTMDFILSEETKANIENYWNALTDIWTDEETNLLDKLKLTFDATKVFLGFELKPEGDVVDALKEGAGGEWGRFWKLISDGWSGIALLLLTLKLTSTAIKGILLAIGSVFGNTTGALGVGGISTAIGLITLAVQLKEAYETGSFDKFARNVLVAALTGAIGGAVFGGPTWALLGFNLALNLKLGEVVEDIPKAIGEQFGIPREHWDQLEEYEEYRQEMIDNSGLAWWERFIGRKPEGLLGFQEWLVEMGYATEPAVDAIEDVTEAVQELGEVLEEVQNLAIPTQVTQVPIAIQSLPGGMFEGLPDYEIENIENMNKFLADGGLEALLKVSEALDVAPETILAQWAIETSWFKGDSLADVYNFAGMKAAPGEPYVERMSPEWENGQQVMRSSKFRVFESIDEFVDFFVESIQRKWPLAQGADTPQDYGQALIDKSMYPDDFNWVGVYSTLQDEEGNYDYHNFIADVQETLLKYLDLQELAEMARTYGYDTVQEFVNGVDDGTTELEGQASDRFEYLVQRWIHDLAKNDLIAQRWGSDFIQYFVRGVERESAKKLATMQRIADELLMPLTFDNPENDAMVEGYGEDAINYWGLGASKAMGGVMKLLTTITDALFDNIGKKIREKYPELIEFYESLKSEVDETIREVDKLLGLGLFPEPEDIRALDAETRSWIKTLTDGLASSIAYGQSLTDVFDNFLRMIAQSTLAKAFDKGADWLINLILNGASLFGGGKKGIIGGGQTLQEPMMMFHFGGLVMHNGGVIKGLRPDEVPIIAQKGERILSRKQNDEFEQMLEDLHGTGGQSMNLNIYANDAKSFVDMVRRNPEGIISVLVDDYQGNGIMRRLVRG